MRKTDPYHRPLFLSIVCCLIVLLAACSIGSQGNGPGTGTPTVGNTPTSGSTPSPTQSTPTVPVPPTQTSCPASGTGRAAVTAPLALGSHQNIIYLVNEYQHNTSTFGTVKRYDGANGNKTEIVKLANTTISDAQVSQDGQLVLFVAISGNQAKLQMIRVDGQGLQTLYCATPPANGANPASAIGNIQWSPNQQLVVFANYASDGGHDYLLNMQTGSVQTEISTGSGLSYPPLTWLDNTRVYLLTPMVDAPSSGVVLLNTSLGPNQNPTHLQHVFDSGNGLFCWDADSTPDGTHLFTSQCATDPSTTGPGIAARHGPSVIHTQPATSGTPQSVLTIPNMAVTVLRAISNTTLLLIVNNNGTSADTSHNGLWKINTDGTGLTQLTSDGGGVAAGPSVLCPYTQYPWSNISRDGNTFAVQHNSANGTTQSLLFGALRGGQSTIFASISDGTQLSIVGWTTL